MHRPTLAVLNGPNLNLLGEREPAVYGSTTLAGIEERCHEVAAGLGFDVDFRQCNGEGDLVEDVHDVRHLAGLVLNAAAYTHTSIAVRDAVALVSGPVIEVHLTNIHARESFRHTSHLSGLAAAVIVGCGADGYEFAIRRIASITLGAAA